MKPATHTLTDLFGGNVRYIVPLYQRPYVWQEKTHWLPLWEDVTTVAEHHLAGHGAALTHFLGAVVLEQEKTAPGELPRHLVIDGQQRLTTLQLMLAGIAKQAQDDTADLDARLLRALVINDPDLAPSEEQQLKVWPTNVNRAEFKAVMANAGGDGTIAEAHLFFGGACRRWVREDGVNEQASRYRALRVALTDLLQVVSINLEGGDNAQVIFETLNARGTPLLAMDLVKNALFRRAELQAMHDVDDLHATVWEPQLGEPRWREEQRQGRLKRPRAELFLMHWLTMRLVDVVPATELFNTFRLAVLDSDDFSDAGQLVRVLCDDAGVMRAFEEADVQSDIGRFFDRLAALDTTTVIPIVLWLYTKPQIDEGQRQRALAALESWLVRRMLCGLTTKNYNRLAVDLLRALETASAPADEALVRVMDEWDQPSNRWPRDNEVRQVMTTRGMYGWIAQKRLAMVLSAVERQRRASTKTEGLINPNDKLSIEHVMPQSWRNHWPAPTDASGDETEAAATAREALLHTIGNLTLVTPGMNSALSDSAWSAKRTALPQHSLLLLNAEIAGKEVWDDEAIRARSAQLTDEIIAIWPGPPTPRPLPTTQSAQPTSRVTYVWTLPDLVAEGKLVPGEQLRPKSERYKALATVTDDGHLLVNGTSYTAPSPAARAVTGSQSEPGWNFWCAERHGSLVEIFDLRAEMGSVEDLDEDHLL